eukprot:TRINITY_DN1241_c0_g1_i5.p1 TRINITY_DN1241_c0_g1~~TRINITY_DN1241_c0_g1_i5.p1  ORF type:complete len:344 (-),score=123.94 TRINITY_DN1241_c0_g1_i5:111-1016(-)
MKRKLEIKEKETEKEKKNKSSPEETTVEAENTEKKGDDPFALDGDFAHVPASSSKNATSTTTSTTTDEEKKLKKKLKLKKLKEKRREKWKEEVQQLQQHEDVSAQRTYFWKKYLNFMETTLKQPLSSLELEAEALQDQNFVRMSGKLVNFLNKLFPGGQLKKTQKEIPNGSPFVILCASSAVRANDLFKELNAGGLNSNSKEVKLGKLFARHLKMEDQILELQGAQTNIAIGTPNRLKKLCENGALKIQEGRTKFLFIDAAKDKKNLTIFDVKDTFNDMFGLYKDFCLDLVKKGKLKICLF